MRITTIIFTITLWISCVTSLTAAEQSLPDTPENRLAAAKHYFEVASMEELMEGMAAEMSKTLPPEQGALFKTMMAKHVRIPVVEEAATKSLAKHLNLAEITLLTKFLEDPVGKSAMGKMKFYMADLMPVIQAEVGRAIKLAQESTQAPNSSGASSPPTSGAK